MPLVSVIIPVYNVEIYLEEMLEGIREQTLRDIEIICVDDGSTDSSAEIIKKQAQKDTRIKYIYQQNQGGGAARNTGIDAAKGKYLICLDADDIYEQNMLELLYNQAEKTDADITICEYISLNMQTGHLSPHKGIRFENIPHKEVFSRKDSPDILQAANPGPTNKLYNRAFVKDNNLKYSLTKSSNDFCFTLTAMSIADRITLVKKALTIYRFLSPASGSAKREKLSYQCFIAYKDFYRELVERNLFDEMKDLYYRRIIASVNYELSFPVGENYISALKDFFKQEPFNKLSKNEIADLFRYRKFQKRYFENTIFCILTLGMNKSLLKKKESTKNILNNLKSILDLVTKTSFNSSKYWEKRYKQEKTSGAGSYGRLAQFKAEVINNFVNQNNIRSVIELGCGDGNQLKLFKIAQYTGYDVSKTIIKKNKKLFSSDKTKTFKVLMNKISENADCTLSLDVIYHLVEDNIFENYMKLLFSASNKYVVIYSSNKDEYQTIHVKHRNFTKWIEKNLVDWKLKLIIKNKYPFDVQDPDNTSFADFYFYEKDSK